MPLQTELATGIGWYKRNRRYRSLLPVLGAFVSVQDASLADDIFVLFSFESGFKYHKVARAAPKPI